jgi:hypothetical protein
MSAAVANLLSVYIFDVRFSGVVPPVVHDMCAAKSLYVR